MSGLLWKPKRAAEEIGITVKTLHEHVKAGEIVYVPIGLGTKRPRLAFVPEDVKEFIQQRRRRAACQSTNPKTARSSITTSKLEGSGFMALRERLNAERRKRSKQ